MATFVARSWRFTRCQSKKGEYRIIFYAYDNDQQDDKKGKATFEAADVGDEEDLARNIFGALAKAWPTQTITLDVDVDRRILGVVSVP